MWISYQRVKADDSREQKTNDPNDLQGGNFSDPKAGAFHARIVDIDTPHCWAQLDYCQYN